MLPHKSKEWCERSRVKKANIANLFTSKKFNFNQSSPEISHPHDGEMERSSEKGRQQGGR